MWEGRGSIVFTGHENSQLEVENGSCIDYQGATRKIILQFRANLVSF
jgi:hypothetical protein